MSPLQIRPARSSDVEKIVSMLRTIHTTHLAWDAARWTTATPPHTLYGAWVEELIRGAGADGIALVAETDETTVGYLLAEVSEESTRHWSPRAVYLHDIFVVDTHRRRGVADALMKEVVVWAARTHPTLQLRLLTASANDDARRFFARHGFRACAVEMLRDSGR